MARLYWSLCRLTQPSNVSGGAYSGVTPPVRLVLAPSRSLTSPKSATLTWLWTRNRFCGLMSRCWSWCCSFIRSRASAASSMYRSSSAGGCRAARSARHSSNRSMQVLVGQLHDDDELAVDDLEPLDGQDERVADRLDAVERLVLLLGRLVVLASSAVEVAEDELDRLVDAARRLALPHLAEPAAAEPLDQAVARDRLGGHVGWVGPSVRRHGGADPRPVGVEAGRCGSIVHSGPAP